MQSAPPQDVAFLLLALWRDRHKSNTLGQWVRPSGQFAHIYYLRSRFLGTGAYAVLRIAWFSLNILPR